MAYSPGNYNTPIPGYGTSIVDRMNIYLRVRRGFKFLAQRWLLLIIFTAIGLGIGVWIAISKPDVYRASTILTSNPRISLGRNESASEDVGIEANVSLMNSPSVLARVTSKLQENKDSKYGFGLPDTRVTPQRGNMFVLSATSTNLEYAKDFVGAWGTEFIEVKKQNRKGMLGTTEAQLQQQILSYENKYELAQQSLDDFRKQNNIASFQDAGISALARLDKKKQQYDQMKLDLKLFESTDAETLANNGVISPGSLPVRVEKAAGNIEESANPADASSDNVNNRLAAGTSYTSVRKSIHRLEAEIKEKSGILKPKHPYLVELNRALEQSKDQLKVELQLVEEMRQARVMTIRQSLPGLEKIIEDLRTEVFESSDTRSRLQGLEEERKTLKDNLDILKHQLQGMGRISTDEDTFQVQGGVQGNSLPVGPNRPQLILTGAGAGFMLAVGLMFLLHRLDDRIENPEEIEAALEEPVLGQLPEVDKKHNPEGYLLLTRMKAHTMFAESLRGVRSALLLSPEGSNKRMLAVTSAVPGDGKTTFTANFAVTIASAGNRTLLIDADLRRGNINGYFEQPLEGGLAEVLDGRMPWQEAVRETQIKNLYFMRAGERPSNPSELLIGPKTRELIATLRKEFDYVIFDCPPLTAIDDTFSIAAFLDGLFFVVRAGRTSMRFAKIGLSTIHQRGAPLLGLIVNGVPIDNPYYYYTSYYYASYYHRPLTPDENIYQDAADRHGRGLVEAGADPSVPLVAGSEKSSRR
jgi:capsular exopolysaccharide synthesis family protein